MLIVGLPQLVAERATGEIALSLFATFVHGGMSRERTMAVMRPSSAVALSAEVQQAMPERNTGFGADNRIELRIGINLGDVIVEGDDHWCLCGALTSPFVRMGQRANLLSD